MYTMWLQPTGFKPTPCSNTCGSVLPDDNTSPTKSTSLPHRRIVAIVGGLVRAIVRVVGGLETLLRADWMPGRHPLPIMVIGYSRRTQEMGEGKHNAGDYTESAQARSHSHLRTATHGYACSLRTAIHSCNLKCGIGQSRAANYCLLPAYGKSRPSSSPAPPSLALAHALSSANRIVYRCCLSVAPIRFLVHKNLLLCGCPSFMR